MKRWNILLITLSLSILAGCGYKQINFKEGKHSRFLAIGGPNIKGWRAANVIFSEWSKYNTPETVDSLDYHKLFGFGSITLDCGLHGDVGMVGWRYNEHVDSFELTAYTHYDCDEKPQHAYDDYMMRVGVGERVTCYIEAGEGYWGYVLATAADTLKVNHHRVRGAIMFKNVDGWIGGSYAATSDLAYYIDYLHKKPFGDMNLKR